AIAASSAKCVAVSPIVAGEAIKGPTAKLMRELGVAPGVAAIAAHYQGLIDGLVLDVADADCAPSLGVPCTTTRSVMRSDDDRVALAGHTLDFAAALAGGERGR